MNISVVMPQLGESVTEGEVTRWLKSEGDPVERDEAIVEVKTDKATVEIPSPSSGTLAAVLVKEGASVKVGVRIAEISTTSAQASTAVERPSPKARMVEPPVRRPQTVSVKVEAPVAKPEAGGRLRMTPLAKRIAQELGLDTASLHGTGARGKITREDVMQARGPSVVAQPQAVPAEPAADANSGLGADEEAAPLSPMRRRIAARMLQSAQTIPQVTTVAQVDMTRVMEMREVHKPAFGRDGLKLTYLPFIMDAAVRALKEFREVNASWGGDKLILHNRVHLGIAVAVEGGLAVPVIRNADGLSLRDLTRRLAAIAEHARGGKLTPDEAQGSTFTITNPGLFGAVASTPLVNPPNAAILGVCRIAPAAVVREGQVVARTMTNLCLSYDHRIVDGETAIKFLQHMRRTLEDADFVVDA